MNSSIIILGFMISDRSMRRLVPEKDKFSCYSSTYEISKDRVGSRRNFIDSAQQLQELFDKLQSDAKKTIHDADCRFVLSADVHHAGVMLTSTNHSYLNHASLAHSVSAGGIMLAPGKAKPSISVNGKERRIHISNRDFSHNPMGLSVFTNIVLYLRALESDRQALLVARGNEQLENSIQLTHSLDYLYSISPSQARLLYIYGFGDYPDALPKIVAKICGVERDIMTLATDTLILQLESIAETHWQILKQFISIKVPRITLENPTESIAGVCDEARAALVRNSVYSKSNLFRNAASKQGILVAKL